jgi:superfamily II DNA or RNA helicase
MSYFSDHYGDVFYPLAAADRPGLYNAQVGAVHRLASHFTVDEQPAVVTMPTGSGKTAVLMMLPFILRSARTLVITPSRLVRGQIADDFRGLQTLREIGVVPDAIPRPRLAEIRKRIDSREQWEALRDYDIVVSTPNCTSPAYADVPEPPADLFDLLIIDEAHHSPAHTWATLLESFKHIRRALFSATPFRRDRGEIPGRFIYTYPVAKAYSDRIFGRIEYVQVEPAGAVTNDVAIARKAEEVFTADRAAGLNHFIMVRTDRKSRAGELADIYRRETQLRLKVVHSGLSNRAVKAVLGELERGELDGVICVNMMGEGFNFPRLKIAAIHAPHRSLEVTLQFIGRFARTNAPDIGDAKFIAVLSEIEIERKRLFDDRAIWQEIIPALSYGRIAEEVRVREVIEEFESPVGADAPLTDLSLYSLYPRSHVKIYDVQAPVDLHSVEFDWASADDEISYRNVNADGSVLVLIRRTVSSPKWSATDAIMNVHYDLFILYYDRETRLLFINSSRSVDGTYEDLAQAVSEDARPLATGQIGKVVKDITNKRIFNVGMRNIQAANTRESYKILAASDAQIDPADARRYRQGHVFLTGEEAGTRTTIGYSSGAKVWSASSDQIPALIDWCRELGAKIRSAGAVVTNSGLDYLDAGRVVADIPANIIYVQWNKDAFDTTVPTFVQYVKDDGAMFRGGHILDLDLELDRAATNQERIRVVVSGDGLAYPIDFSLDDFYSAHGQDEGRISIVRGSATVHLIDYLNEAYLDFYTADGSLFSGNELFEPKENAVPIDSGQLTVWDWTGVDIENEVAARPGFDSVHRKVRAELEAAAAPVIFYDHGSGEIADYLTIREEPDAVIFGLYHCKGSGGPIAGARVDDVYEVCGQTQKSVAWSSLARLERRLRTRVQPAKFIRGDEALLRDVLDRAKGKRQRFEIKVVQPGISKALVTQAMAECLGATNSHLIGVGIAPLEVIASA